MARAWILSVREPSSRQRWSRRQCDCGFPRRPNGRGPDFATGPACVLPVPGWRDKTGAPGGKAGFLGIDFAAHHDKAAGPGEAGGIGLEGEGVQAALFGPAMTVVGG